MSSDKRRYHILETKTGYKIGIERIRESSLKNQLKDKNIERESEWEEIKVINQEKCPALKDRSFQIKGSKVFQGTSSHLFFEFHSEKNPLS